MCLLQLDDLRIDTEECYSFRINYMDIGWLKQCDHDEKNIPTIIGETILEQIAWHLKNKNE